MNFARPLVPACSPRECLVRCWQGALLVFAVLFPMMASALVAPSSVSLSSNKNPTAFAEGTWLIARVQGGSGAFSPRPSGTVVFSDSLASPKIICAAVTLTIASGTNAAEAACKFSVASVVGNHTISATYNGDSNYSATFVGSLIQVVVPSYTALGAAGNGGTVTPDAHYFVPRGEGVAFDFTSQRGYRLTSVSSACGGVTDQQLPASGAVRFSTNGLQADCAVRGTFSNLYAVKFTTTTGGTVSPAGTNQIFYESLTRITVTPNPGYRLTNVYGCGVVFFGAPMITGSTTWNTGAITADCEVTAYFTALPSITVTSAAGAGGSITPASQSVLTNTTAQFTVTPNSGFAVASVNGCGGSLSGSVYTTAPITSACAVSASFTPSSVAPTPVSMIEFYHPPLNYYFLTSRATEIALLDATPPFTRTGQSFPVYRTSVAGTQPITRFYFDRVAVNASRGSHFYTVLNAEVLALHGLNPTNSNAARQPFDEGVDSYAFLPVVEGVGGSCALGQTPVFRLFRGNQRFPDDPNHRFTTSTAIYNSFVAQGWDGEGVKLCAPQ